MSTRTPRGRTLALVAAVGVVAVAAVAAARLEQMATRYHLYRLESDGGYLEQLIDLPELSAAQEGALQPSCETGEGGRALMNAVVARLLTQAEGTSPPIFGRLDIGIDGNGRFWNLERHCLNVRVELPIPEAQGRRLHRLLQFVDGRQFVLGSFPGCEFKVQWHDLGSHEPVVRAVRVGPHDHDRS